MAQLIKPVYKTMKGFSLFKRHFAQSTNDFSVTGSSLITDGSGETNFRSSVFQDYMNGSTINNHNWKTTLVGTGAISPVLGKGLDISTYGANPLSSAILTAKGSTGRINLQSFIILKINVKGYTAGGTAMATVNGENTANKIFFGMYKDEDNYIGVKNAADGLSAEHYVLVNKFNGSVTTSSAFTIAADSNPDQLLEIRMSIDNVEFYLNGVLTATNTTNIPNNAELRTYIKLLQGATTGDNRIYVDYIKVEQ
jgi:hypothetical protein